MTRHLLPRHMTEEQRQGFRIAMECVRTWGRQLVTAAYLPSPGDLGEDLAQSAATGRALQACAAALDRTIGQARTFGQAPTFGQVRPIGQDGQGGHDRGRGAPG